MVFRRGRSSLGFSLHLVSITIHNLFNISMLEINPNVAIKRIVVQVTVFVESCQWADSAGWTGWEVLTVHDEWKMALVTVLVEVERVTRSHALMLI